MAISFDFSIRRKIVEKLNRANENHSTVCKSDGRIPPVYHPQVIRTCLAVVRRRLRPGDSDVMFGMSNSARCFSCLRCLAVAFLAATIAIVPALRSVFAADVALSGNQTSDYRFVAAAQDSGGSAVCCIRSTSVGAGDLARCERQIPGSDVASPAMTGVETTRRHLFFAGGRPAGVIASGSPTLVWLQVRLQR